MLTNPFALPVHPMLVHFPIAMLTTMWVCLVARYATGRERWEERARLFQIIGLGSLPVAMIAALIDTRGFDFVADPRWDAPLIWHAVAGVAAALVFGGHFLWRRRLAPDRMTGWVAAADLGLASLGLWALVTIGLLAGEMVYNA